MKRPLIGPFVLLAVATAAMPGFAAERKPVRSKPAKFELTGKERRKVENGDITIRHVNSGSVNEFYSAGYVKANVDDVFWYYQDHNNTPKYQDSIKKISVEEDHSPKRGNNKGEQGGYRRLDYMLQLPWPIGTRRFVLDLEGDGEPEKYGDIWWSLNSGDIAEMMGSYVVSTYWKNPKWTLVRYWVKADMNTWIPGWLIGFVQGRTIPNVISQARKDLE